MQILNTQLPPSPRVRFFFLCDGITPHNDDPDRRMDVAGLLTGHRFTGRTPQMLPGNLTIAVAFGIYTEDRSVLYKLRITGREGGEAEFPLWSSPIGLVNNQYVPIVRQSCDLEFSRPGTYWFKAYLDGDLVGEYPLTIEYSQEGQTL